MAWKKCGTSMTVNADVELGEFGTEQLLQELINRKTITEADAEAMLKLAKNQAGELRTPADAFDDLSRADLALRRGLKSDALVYIEQHLGREWYGRLQ